MKPRPAGSNHPGRDQGHYPTLVDPWLDAGIRPGYQKGASENEAPQAERSSARFNRSLAGPAGISCGEKFGRFRESVEPQKRCASVAQLVERLSPKQDVAGSNPAGRARNAQIAHNL